MLDPQAPISPGQTEGRRRHSMVLSIGSIPIYVKSATRLKHDGGEKDNLITLGSVLGLFFLLPVSHYPTDFRVTDK